MTKNSTVPSSIRELVRAERQDLWHTLAGLDAEQWEAPSLCKGWSVSDVAAHVIGNDELAGLALAARFVRGGFLPDRINQIGVENARARSTPDLLTSLGAHLEPRGPAAALGGRLGLVDALVHHQDIRRPLGLSRDIPRERLLPALGVALYSPILLGVRRVRGLRLIAHDIGWTWGNGQEVSGTGEALLMAIAGRASVVVELSGVGVDRLSRRLVF
jgi:uncharacterized protein (TIGR03083 family)